MVCVGRFKHPTCCRVGRSRCLPVVRSNVFEVGRVRKRPKPLVHSRGKRQSSPTVVVCKRLTVHLNEPVNLALGLVKRLLTILVERSGVGCIS